MRVCDERENYREKGQRTHLGTFGTRVGGGEHRERMRVRLGRTWWVDRRDVFRHAGPGRWRSLAVTAVGNM